MRSGALQLKAAEQARKLYAWFREDPDRLVESGHFRIQHTDWRGFDDEPAEVEAQAEAEAPSLLPSYLPFTLDLMNGPQRWFKQIRLHRRAQGIPCRTITVKGRQVGLTTYIQKVMLSRALLRSGFRGLTIGRDQSQVENQAMAATREVWSRLLVFNMLIEATTDRVDKLAFKCDIPGMELGGSSILATGPNLQQNDSERGGNWSFVHSTEDAFQMNRTALRDSIIAAVRRTKDFEYHRESTLKDDEDREASAMFIDEFTERWEAQGSLNFWDAGWVDTYEEIAVFFPPYMHANNIGSLKPGRQWDELEAAQDDTEKKYFGLAYDYHRRMGIEHAVAKRRALGVLAFRRGMLPNGTYKDDIVRGGDRFSSARKFVLDFPFTVEEAKLGPENTSVLSDDAKNWCVHTAKERPPVFIGNLFHAGSNPSHLTLQRDSDFGTLRIWRFPWDTEGMNSLTVDPNRGAKPRQGMVNPWDHDYTYAASWNWPTGDQNLSFNIDQAEHLSAEDIWALALLLNTRIKPSDKALNSNVLDIQVESKNREHFPFYTQEQNIGTGISMFLYHFETTVYPRDRIFQRLNMNNLDDVRSGTDYYGLMTSDITKHQGVVLMEAAINTGMAEYLFMLERNTPQPPRSTMRRIVRCPILAEQLGWYVRSTERRKAGFSYGAVDKGRKTRKSKDDAVTVLWMDTTAEDQALYRQIFRPGVVQDHRPVEKQQLDFASMSLHERLRVLHSGNLSPSEMSSLRDHTQQSEQIEFPEPSDFFDGAMGR